ncbi:hypothetical protein STVA_22700 [Allostella vacuolata]|nr:hypothetical protein STVA_22700 [Stella vacuolata]
MSVWPGDPETVSTLLGELYEAAGDPRRWPQVMDRFGALLGGVSVHLFVWDGNLHRTRMSVASPWYDEETERLYGEHWGALDPRRVYATKLKAGETFFCHQPCDEAFVRRDPFYNEFLLPYCRTRFLLGSKLSEVAGSATFLGVHRTAQQGPFGATDAARVSFLTRHVLSAIALGERLTLSEGLGSDLIATVDRIPTCIFLTDGDGMLRHANRAAERALEASDGFTARNRRLAAIHGASDQRLRLALRAATQGAGDALHVARGDGTAWDTVVSPLRESRHPSGTILISAIDPYVHDRAALTPSASIFAFTTAETDVAAALLAGRSPKAISEDRGVSLDTVRVQIRSMLSKTRTQRQAELVARLARMAVLRDQ